MENVLSLIKSKALSYSQKVISLARAAENMAHPIEIDPNTAGLIKNNIICDLFEGNAPYRPRYIIVDFEKFMHTGSEFLALAPPKDIWEACNNLLILYKHIPSITTMPVYIGNLDTLLEPYITDENEAYKAIKLFMTHIDRTITDSFCHANIGPYATKAGRILLDVTRELDNAIPNITLKYDNTKTDDDFAVHAVSTALSVAKPSFANDNVFRKDFGGDYAIASCYNGLAIGGGSHTLVRVRLSKLAETSENIDDFFKNRLPECVNYTAGLMDKRIRFLVEESGFFQSSFLVDEKLISLDNFTAMFGIVGLAECVNHLMKLGGSNGRFGHDKSADKLGLEIIATIDTLLALHPAPYCKGTGSRYLLHAQVGIDTDTGITPGCRIPVGEEPDMYNHLVQSAPFHKYFPSGIGDVFRFDEMASKNPEAVLDIIKGAFNEGLRYFSLYEDSCDVVRITGYLVKKSEIKKLEEGNVVMNNATVLGKGAKDNLKILDRKLRR